MPSRDYSAVKAELEANRGLTRMLRRIRKWSWICWLSLAFVLVIAYWALCSWFSVPTRYLLPSLLGGPAGLTILVIVIGLSGYLRAVAGAADEKIEIIRAGNSALYPKIVNGDKDGRTACTEKKLEALEATFWKLQVAAGFLIVLSFVVAARLLADSLLNLSASLSATAQFYVRIWDCLIFLWLTLATVGLAIMHWRARSRDERIRTMAETCRREHESRSETPSEQPG